MEKKVKLPLKSNYENKFDKKESRVAWLFISPMIVGLLIFYVFAFFQNIYFSFNKIGAFGAPEWVGLSNYAKLFTDDYFFIALKNTIFYAAIGTPLVVLFSIILAVFLNKKVKGMGLYRTAIFLPAITMPAAIGLLWRWLFNYQYGLINFIIEKLGGTPIAWLSEPNTVKWAILIVLVWSMVSYQTIIMLAGLQGIDKSYYEAASIDGASRWDMFKKITLPLLSPTIFYVTIISMIGILQIFDFIFLMIQRTAVSYQYSMSLVSFFYDLAFVQNQRGYASAVTVVLFLIILVITTIQFITQKYWVKYD